MSSRQRLTFVLLTVLVAGPLLGTLCAGTCSSKSTIVQHHSEQHCEEATDSSPVSHVSDSSRHDCTGHQTASIAATAAARIDLGSTVLPVAALFGEIAKSSIPSGLTAIPFSSPPGTAPPTATPVVLRV